MKVVQFLLKWLVVGPICLVVGIYQLATGKLTGWPFGAKDKRG